jgi:hypothetical protein
MAYAQVLRCWALLTNTMSLMPPGARAGALIVAAATLLAVAWVPPSATAGETLTDIKARGTRWTSPIPLRSSA